MHLKHSSTNYLYLHHDIKGLQSTNARKLADADRNFARQPQRCGNALLRSNKC